MKTLTPQRGNAIIVALIGLIGAVLAALISKGYFDGHDEIPPAAFKAAAVPAPAPLVVPASEAATAVPSSRHEKWGCVPFERRGADLENEDPNREQLNRAVLSWVGHGDSIWVGHGDSDALRCAQILLKAGADPNFTDPSYMPGIYLAGGPPLHLAISQKRWDMVELLLKNGADPNRGSIWAPQTAIDVAKASSGTPEAIMASLEKGKQ